MRNHFYRIRFWIYRQIKSKRIQGSSPFIKPGRTSTFADHFTKVSWKGENFRVGEHWGGYHPAHPIQYYGAPSLSPWETGIFTALYKPKEVSYDLVIPYQVSLLSTHGIFSQQYGRFECRCTLPKGRWTWAAFWMYITNGWPPEIDIFETNSGPRGKRAGIQEMNIHWGHSKDKTLTSMGAWPIRVERESENKYHEFAVEWTPRKIEFITDGVTVYQFRDRKILDSYFNVPETKMHLLINHGLKDQKPIGYPVEEFEVDYIRVYAMETPRDRQRKFIKSWSSWRADLYKQIYSCWRCQGTKFIEPDGHIPGAQIPCPECNTKKP